jgi:hypothetical protein
VRARSRVLWFEKKKQWLRSTLHTTPCMTWRRSAHGAKPGLPRGGRAAAADSLKMLAVFLFFDCDEAA